MRTLSHGILALACLRLAFSSASSFSAGRNIRIEQTSTHVRNEEFTRNSESAGWMVGEIKIFAFGADDPALIASLAKKGWVECAGQQIDEADFPEAVAALRGTWGSQNRSNTSVYLPDLRGLVLRGWHHDRQAPDRYPFSPYNGDSDLGSRVFPRPELLDQPTGGIAGPTDLATGQLIKDHVGSMQPEQFHGHSHNFSYAAGNGSIPARIDTASSVRFAGELLRIGGSTEFVGGNETHPPNAFVLYLIYLGRPAYDPPLERGSKAAKIRRVQAL